MELKIFRDALPQAGASCTLNAELALETEVLISDYLPPVFKLVKCFAKPVVLQKRLQPGRLTLDGYLRCIVFYQSEEDEGLCQTEQKLPFTKQLELPEFAFEAWTAVVEGQTEYLNCRAVNPRRIEIRGAYGLVVTVRSQCKTEVITALADGCVEQSLRTVSGVRSVAVMDKLVALEGELEFAKPPAAVLDISGIAQIRELKLLSGKAVVKGEIQVQCVWRSEGETALQNSTLALNLNQVVDLEGLTEDSQCLCVAEPVGFTLTQGEPGAAQQLKASVLLHLRAWRAYQMQYVLDAFSTRFQTAPTLQELKTEQLAAMISETVTVSGTAPLPDAGAQLCACFVAYGPVQMVQKEDGCELMARVMVTAFVRNSLAELESCEKALELSLPLKAAFSPGDELAAECWLSAEDVRCTCTGGTLEVNVLTRVEGALLCRSSRQSLGSMELGEELAADQPEIALRIYYAQAGEEIFAIAKRFHVSPLKMLEANGLDASLQSLPQAQHLLVPGM